MAYISKSNILAAYKKLSQMHPDPNAQGATQKISAIRHFLALDSFYKLHARDCNTRDKNDKEEFANLVGEVCEVHGDLYTTNFYYPLKRHTGDYSVGSNFYSAGQVNASLVNPNEIFDYPKRGSIPLMKVKNGILERNTSLYHNFSNYITSTDYAVALVIWLIRKISIEQNNGQTLYDNIYLALSEIFTPELLNVLFKDSVAFEQELNKYNLIFNENFYSIQDGDIEGLFDIYPNEEKYSDFPTSYQVIFYGAPGTGKSHRIKKHLDGISKENIFRTTFHPDSDYSTFVGAYKPTKGKRPLYGLNGGLTVRLNDGKDDLEEDIITYNFIPQAFLNAYIRAYQTEENVYLIIEEINRGNCAQIFGDLFQLLDRDGAGKSEYTIKADADLRTFLEDKLGCDNPGIKDGELCLPSNLYIYATMNTSDQSLFPIDSAFKRRWDWEYEPIKYKNTDWVIDIDGLKYRWSDFQKEVNTRILKDTGSEDKMLGDYFVNPPAKVISYNLFRNKILFYLWNDVCKDGDADIFPTDADFSFSKLYDEDSKQLIVSMMTKLNLKPIDGDDIEEDGNDMPEDKDNNSSVRYSINGEETDEKGEAWGKGALVKRAVEIFCQNNPDLSAKDIRDRWISVGFKIPHIVETDEDRERRIHGSSDPNAEGRSKEIKLSNGESLHVSTQVGDSEQRKGFSDFLLKIKSRPEWGINIQEL